jgi:hypothetical protein
MENHATSGHVAMDAIAQERQQRNPERFEWEFHDEPFKDFLT